MRGRRAARRASIAPPDTARDLSLTSLAMAAGCVDAVSFLGLGQVLTAAMTGNTVLLGLAFGQADVEAALRSTVALLGFFAGSLLGASMVERDPGAFWSPAVAAALAVELALLVTLGIAWHLGEGHRWVDDRFVLIAVAGLAMGMQSAVAHRAGVAGIATTYVTGTLTTLATRLVRSLRQPGRPDSRIDKSTPAWLPAIVWLTYGLGAVLAGAMYRWWELAASILDIAGDLGWSSAALVAPIVIVTIVGSIVMVKWCAWRASA